MAQDLPQTISAVNDSILQQVIVGDSSGRAFKMTTAELEFYRQMRLPLPRLHPEIRQQQRMALRNPRRLYQRVCMCTHPPSQDGGVAGAAQPNHNHDGQCSVRFETTYEDKNPAIVYCEECYQKELH